MDRKGIKKNAIQNLKKHFFSSVIVTFIAITILGGGYYSTNNQLEFKNSIIQKIQLINQRRVRIESLEYIQSDTYSYNPNSDMVNRALGSIFENGSKDKKFRKAVKQLFFVNNDNKNKNKKNITVNSGNSEETPIKEKETKFKYDKGIAATVFNQVTSRRVAVGIVNTAYVLVYGHDFSNFLTSLLFTILSIMLFFLVKRVIVVGKNRYFLEERRYTETRIDKILFPYRIKKTLHIARILFLQYIYQFLWNLTIIGGVIKKYEYMFIPYVLAENPNISQKQAFRLSKELAQGNKWELFKLELTLIPFYIIGILTINVTNILFFNSYYECIIAETYIRIRRDKYEELTDKDLLNDDLLDIPEYIKGEYPVDKYPTKTETRRWLVLDYNRKYSIQNLILFFFTFAFIGYIYEVFLSLVSDGILANRGMLRGPWLPIYGVGGILILILLKRIRNNPWRVFIASVLLAGIVEYLTSWYLETFLQLKYWDYTGFFLNIQGRVCFDTLMVFGIGGCAFTYLLAPAFDNIYNHIKIKNKNVLCTILLVIFAIDLAFTIVVPNEGKGINDYEMLYSEQKENKLPVGLTIDTKEV